jgi:DNA-binding GntR family transcriptional regulator
MITSTRLKKVNLAAQAYENIRNLILEQDVSPDDPINIDMLASSLGVSPTPVREALARLEGDRLVIRLASGRYRVAPALDRKGFADLYDVRMMMEPPVAAAAARNRPDETVATLEALVARIAKAGRGQHSRDFVDFVEADRLFHGTIAIAAGNDFVVSIMAQLQANLRVGPFYRDKGVVDAEAVIEDHAAICEAVAGRDPGAAEAAMRGHIARARALILGWVDDHNAVPAVGSGGGGLRSQPAREDKFHTA